MHRAVSVRILIASPLETEHLARIAAVDPRLEVIYRPDLIGSPRYVGDHTPLVARSEEQSAEWASLLATLEAALRLHRHEPGTLPKLTRYLHQRTGGMIGSLSHLVRAAALTAILDGGEQITRKLLDSIPVDHAAQSAAHGVA